MLTMCARIFPVFQLIYIKLQQNAEKELLRIKPLVNLYILTVGRLRYNHAHLFLVVSFVIYFRSSLSRWQSNQRY